MKPRPVGFLSLLICLFAACSAAHAQAGFNGQPFSISDLGIDMLPVQPGTFVMGISNPISSPTSPMLGNPPTQVTLTKGYWLGRTEVTQGQWMSVMGNNTSSKLFSQEGPNEPAEDMSWDAAMDFCKKLTTLEQGSGHIPAGYKYTLPSEAQWEYACRAGATGEFTGDVGAVAWYKTNAKYRPYPVGQKQPNAWGFYDMFGNVWEMCRDGWAAEYPGGNVTDPVITSTNDSHVIVGGSWPNTSDFCQYGVRMPFKYGLEQYNLGTVGFRVCLAPM
jgi:formylglycine-generating enzyme required for sulfatase activity